MMIMIGIIMIMTNCHDDDDDDGCEPEGWDMKQVGSSLVDQVSLPAANRRNLENFKTWKTFRFWTQFNFEIETNSQ